MSDILQLDKKTLHHFLIPLQILILYGLSLPRTARFAGPRNCWVYWLKG